jgi:predicted transcriptional regulator
MINSAGRVGTFCFVMPGLDPGIHVFLPCIMAAKTESIELDSAIASALKSRAAERGVSVSQLVAELIPLAVDDEAIAELDRRWAVVEKGAATVPHADVERWLRSWGTPDFRPWSEK